MPTITPVTPIAPPTVGSLVLKNTMIDSLSHQVYFNYAEIDSGGLERTKIVSMTEAAFTTAFTGASGGLNARLGAAFQTAVGVAGTLT